MVGFGKVIHEISLSRLSEIFNTSKPLRPLYTDIIAIVYENNQPKTITCSKSLAYSLVC